MLTILWLLSLPWSLGRLVRGEAHRPAEASTVGAPGADGGHEPRGGGDLHATSRPRGLQVSDNPRPSVPTHDQLLNYRPARENRYWVNDFALAGALDAWSREVSS